MKKKKKHQICLQRTVLANLIPVFKIKQQMGLDKGDSDCKILFFEKKKKPLRFDSNILSEFLNKFFFLAKNS